MVNLQKSGNSAVKFVFTDSDHYLYGNGEIEVPVNSLLLVIDESDMVTFKKLSGDPFLSFRADNSNLGTKAAIEQFYKENMVGSTGGVSSGDVETMIDASLEDYYDKDEIDAGFGDVEAALSGKADTTAVTEEISAAVSGKADTSAVTTVSNALTAHTADTTVHVTSAEKTSWNSVSGKVDTSAVTSSVTSGSTDSEIPTAKAVYDAIQANGGYLIDLDTIMQRGLTDTEWDGTIDAVTNERPVYIKVDGYWCTLQSYYLNGNEMTLLAASSNFTSIYTVTKLGSNQYSLSAANKQYVSQAEKDAWNAKQDALSAGTGIEISGNVISATGGSSVTVDSALDSGSTNPVANSAVTAGIDDAKAYYIDFATLTTQGIHDSDWDALVAAVAAHRPLYAVLGAEYYVSECLAQSGNQIILTASNQLAHYFYTFTKNGSNDYAFSYETRPYTTDAEKTLWNSVSGKVDTSAITSSITSASTNSEVAGAKAVYDAIQAQGGGGSSVTVDSALDSGSTNPVANSAITVGIDDAKAYYISFATIATTGIHDEDWDGIVAAIDDHRPIYAGYPRNDGGIIYYGVECMSKNVTNTEIVMTTSDENRHYFYTFTKNGSEDYAYTVDTKPYVPDITTAITSGSTDAQVPTAKAVYDATQSGGGGATYSAGTNISIDSANTINCTIPLTSGSGYSDSYNLKGGNNVNSTGMYSFAFGDALTADRNGSAAFGHANVSNSTGSNFFNGSNNSYLFTVGNGWTSAFRHNALEIRQSGNIYFADTDNTTYSNYYEKPMVRLQDMYAALGGLKFVQCTQSEYDALVSGGTVDSSTIYFISNVVS